MNPVKWSLRYPTVTVLLTVMVFVVGLHALVTMPRREDPKITIRQGLVVAYYPGATAEQVEEQVAKKIEERLFRFAEVRKAKTFSTSRPGIVIVNVELEESVNRPDEFWSKLRHDMNELHFLELPVGVQGPIVNSDFGDVVAILLAVQGTRYDYRTLKDYLDRIDDGIRTVPAVSKIKRYGEQQEQIYVTSTLERLSQYRVTPLQVVQTLQAQNVVENAGTFDAEQSEVRLRTTGLFQSEDQIRRLMVYVSPTTGQPVYLGDIAAIERRYQDPTYLTRLNGRPALLLSAEMQEGNNIVDFGVAVDRELERVRALLPPDLSSTLVANQPQVVEERIAHFVREFGIAIAAVIMVTMLLLPFRVAVIAALAIPVTIAVTFGAMNALGIELHQVSIAALIVVLGMVVDDAIVIADNYVELLDHGVERAEAAWRSASELAVPVLGATLTIIASFLPLALLPGTTGEFIRSLPITVTVALACSYVVAMLLTPVLCRAFIKAGLHGAGSSTAPRRRFSPLDFMQQSYDRTIGLAMQRKRLTMALGVAAFGAGVVLLGFRPQRFFPSAERDQFVVDVWMPEGTRIEATDAVVRRIERALGHREDIREVASFIGAGAPRFYYNVSPEPPAPNYAQLVVRASSAEETPKLVPELDRELRTSAPEAQVLVKELQQGAATAAPIEVRIVGEDIRTLKRIALQVEEILRRTPGSLYVRSNFHEDAYDLLVDLNTEVANREALTTSSIARQLAGSFQGAPVSTFWEGSDRVEIVLRLDESRRQSFDNIRNAYLTSNITGARVPLLEVARLRPEWRTSRIVRRNGIRTLTVLSEPGDGYLASGVLAKARSAIDTLSLPPGYRIEYGGELENQEETFGHMQEALLVSLVSIFLILVFQFRSVKEPLVVMVSIPLALVGAALGLMLTRNPFGFTAFLGLISLTGIVVRNAIILVDYIVEQRQQGMALEQAALDAGKRRLRPIFLTTVAAAIGVQPMILSGSSLWSPLASVISVGLLCSMVFTLVVVPVLYVLVERGRSPSSP